jgi:nuclear pore complex protein Nup155
MATARQVPVPVDLSALQNASCVLLDQFAKDAQIIPDLGDTLTARTQQALFLRRRV